MTLFVYLICFSRQGFSIALESVLLAGLELTETCLPLPPSAGIKVWATTALLLYGFI